MRIIKTLLFLLFSLPIHAQLSKKETNKVEQKILHLINDQRQKEGVPALTVDTKLHAAAKIQADYLVKLDTLSDKQKSGKNKSIEGRLKTAKADYELGNQLVFEFSPENSKLQTACITYFQNELQDNLNPLLSGDYNNIGFAWSTRKKDQFVLLSIVLGRVGITVEGQLSKNSFGLRPITKECSNLFEGNELIHLINATYVDGNEVKLKFNNRSNFEALFPGPKDGIAVDLISSEQFICNGMNEFDKSKLYDGILLKPIFRDELLQSNTSKGDFRIHANIGDIPEQLVDQAVLPNIIYIRNGEACSYQILHYIEAENYKMMPFDPSFNFSFNPLSTSGSIRTIQYDFTFEPGETVPKGIFIPTFSKDSIYAIEIFSYSSVDGAEKSNTELHEKRAQAIKSLAETKLGKFNKPVKSYVSENWEKCYLQLESLGLDSILSLSKEKIRQFVITDTTHNWASLLAEQRVSTIIFHIKGTRDSISQRQDFLQMNIRTALLNGNLEQANHALFKMYHEGLQTSLLLEKGIIDRLLIETSLVQNASSLLSLHFNPKDIRIIGFVRNWLRQPEGLSSKTIENLVHLYNLSTFQLIEENWDISNQTYINILDPKRLDYLFKSSSIQSTLEFNFYLTKLNYCDLSSDVEEVVRSFDLLKKYLMETKINDEELLKICLFFNNWNQYQSTIEILSTKLDDTDFNPDLALLLAKTAVSVDNDNNDSQTLKIIKRVQELNKSAWCDWMSFDFQLMRNDTMKSFFCEECME